MKSVIITGHGRFGSGLNSTIETVSGKFDFLKYVDFTQEKNTQTLKKEIETIINESVNLEKIYIFTDLLGGTPFNVACELKLLNENIEVISGTNIPMLIETCMNIQLGLDLDIETIKVLGKNNIDNFVLQLKNQDIKNEYEEDYEDGI